MTAITGDFGDPGDPRTSLSILRGEAYHAPCRAAWVTPSSICSVRKLSSQEGRVNRTSLFRENVGRLTVVALLASSVFTIQAWAQGGDTITIGVVLPITGKEGKPGQYQKEGIDLAIKQINDAGGVFVKDKGKKLPVKTVFYDDGSDSAKSASPTDRAMSSDNVTAVLGGSSTALGEPESVMPDRYHTPWITPGAGATSIFSHGYQYVFVTLSPITLLASTSADFLGSLVDQEIGKAHV